MCDVLLLIFPPPPIFLFNSFRYKILKTIAWALPGGRATPLRRPPIKLAKNQFYADKWPVSLTRVLPENRGAPNKSGLLAPLPFTCSPDLHRTPLPYTQEPLKWSMAGSRKRRTHHTDGTPP